MALHGHTPAQRKKLRGATRGRLRSTTTRLKGKARAASVNKGKQGLRRRSLGQAGRVAAGLPRGGPAPRRINRLSPLSTLPKKIGRAKLETGTVDRRLQTRTGKPEPKSLLSALQRGKRKGRNKVASSMSRRPAKGTVDRVLQLRREKARRLKQLGITRTK